MFKPPRSTAKQTMPSCAGPATPASTRPTSWPRATSAWSSTGVPTGRWAAARIIAGRKPTCTARMLGEKRKGGVGQSGRKHCFGMVCFFW